MTKGKKYFYGPVPSRRLGRSYGVDIVPFKICTLDCVYCQLGRTVESTIERRDYGPVEPVLAELKDITREGLEADYITIAGSGEPTLNSRLGELIDGIKKITNIPVAVLTNGTLLYQRDVRADCAKADVVMPSLDAGDKETFNRINRPHRDISIEKLILGLCTFRDEFAGQIWLEVFFIETFNTEAEQIDKIEDAIERIRPDKIHLNTAVRPTAETGIKRLDAEKLQIIAEKLGSKCEIIADFSLSFHNGITNNKSESHFEMASNTEAVLSMLKRRPCSLDDICTGLELHRNQALKCIANLQNNGIIQPEEKNGKIFFTIK